MIESEERHYKQCQLGDECERCFWISEAHWALSEAGMVIRAEQPKDKIEVKEVGAVVPRSTDKNKHPLYNYILDKFTGD
tara:strand:- start:489 stop:725 length:237 start_codon:yes stop_codon:yes gene_type:complete